MRACKNYVVIGLFVTRSAVVLTGLVLTLPPAWCCPLLCASAPAAKPKTKPQSCCSTCATRGQKAPASPTSPCPAPPTCPTCCEKPNASVLPPGPVTLEQEQALPFALDVASCEPTDFRVRLSPEFSVPGPSPPIHILD